MGTVKGLKRGLVVQLHIVLISHFHYSWSSCRLEELTLFTRPMLCLKAVLDRVDCQCSDNRYIRPTFGLDADNAHSKGVDIFSFFGNKIIVCCIESDLFFQQQKIILSYGVSLKVVSYPVPLKVVFFCFSFVYVSHRFPLKVVSCGVVSVSVDCMKTRITSPSAGNFDNPLRC